MIITNFNILKDLRVNFIYYGFFTAILRYGVNFKPKTLKFCSLMDKKCKREVDIDADYYCFEIDNKFLVGYGLDYDGYYRNIPYVGYVEGV